MDFDEWYTKKGRPAIENRLGADRIGNIMMDLTEAAWNAAKEQAVKADACLCTELKDGADACPYWVAWGKCKKRTA